MDESEFDKTEQATPFKMRKAREKGSVARSLDLGFFAALTAASGFLWVGASGLAAELGRAAAETLAATGGGRLQSGRLGNRASPAGRATRLSGALAEGLTRLSEVSQQIGTRRRVERERLRSLQAEGKEPLSLDEKLAVIGEIAAELAVGIMLEDSVMYLADERDPARSAYETAAWKQAVHRLAQALDTLPERDRTVVRLHYLESVPFEEIARMMGLSKGRISQLHKQALGAMHRKLSDMGNFRLEG